MERSVKVKRINIVDAVEILDILGNVKVGKHWVVRGNWLYWGNLNVYK